MSTVNFNEMLMDNAEFLKPFAITLTHDQEKARDLFQETILRAMTYRDKYHVGTNIKAWLYTIMRNIFINDYRTRARRRLLFDSNAGGVLPDAKQPVAVNMAESQIGEKLIWEAIHSLPGVFKTPFMLHLNGFKYQYISKQLNQPLGTVKSRIHFARKLLRQYLDNVNAVGLPGANG
jgi:RNA polymerase sigma factor (sigma-70 family)